MKIVDFTNYYRSVEVDNIQVLTIIISFIGLNILVPQKGIFQQRIFKTAENYERPEKKERNEQHLQYSAKK